VNDTSWSFDPKTSALLVMDFQNGIVGMVADSSSVLGAAKRAIEAMRASGGHVGYVRVAFDDPDFDALPERNKMSRFISAGRDRLRSDAPETAIHSDIAPRSGDIVVRKKRVGPFLTTDLDEQLRARGVTTLFLAGISTSGVVLSTVRDAADRDYELYVLADACADTDPDVHRVLMEKVFPRQADVITVEEFTRGSSR
jgi:nicotinamidase-related amidase